MTDDTRNDALIAAAGDYNRPPATPREEMWAKVHAARRQAAAARRGRLLRGMGIAASIVIAVAIGRITLDTAAPEIASADRTPLPAERVAPSAFPYEIAAAEHLDEAETLLGFFRTEVRRGDPEPATVAWARDLVGTTRLILDSPAAEDPQLHDLLQDLELVLVQIAQSSDQSHSHVELIEQGIEEGNVMVRLTSSPLAGPALRQE